MKILWMSNAPWCGSGYGNQTALFWPRIVKQLGHDVTLAANFGLNGAPLNVPGDGDVSTRILPMGYRQHGIDVLAPHAERVEADVVITLYDSWVFPPDVTSQFRWAPWMPVDHEPLPEQVRVAIESAWQPIAYSRFGERMLREAGFDPRYVPHGIDTTKFTPADRHEARAKLRLHRDAGDIDFMALMVAANKGTPSRKAFPEVLAAWKRFVDDHPKSVLYLHTHHGGDMAGLDLMLLLRKLEMPDECIVFCDPYQNILGYPTSYMANLYNAADVLLSPSYGEGFGIPIMEAQACGTPVIVNDCTSMSELCFAGWKTGNQPFWTVQGAWQFAPHIDDIYEAICEAYDKRNYDKLRRDARKGAEQYDADLVTREYWGPVLAEMEDEVTAADPLGMVAL